MWGVGFKVGGAGSGLGVQGQRFRVWDLGFGCQGSKNRVYSFNFRALGVSFRV